MSEAVDWRGTAITEGALVIYGAPVGRSIAMVEGVVDGFTDSGRVWVKVKHRAYGGWGSEHTKDRVHVGADRLTIVTVLPPTTLPTEADKVAAEKVRLLAMYEKDLADLRAGHNRHPNYAWFTEEYCLERITDLAGPREKADA